jgi:hypothetical protein
MRAPNGRGRQVARGLGIAAAAAACVPATADAAALIAAYDRFESSKGFDIGLVNVNTGAALSVPAAVNTTDDELHPTLTPDGRYLVFMRTKLQPKLNGDIVPPATRTLHQLDRQTGQVTSITNSAGAGPSFRASGSNLFLAWGIRPQAGGGDRTPVSQHAPFSNGAPGSISDDVSSPSPAPAGQTLETPHAAFVPSVHTDFDPTLNGQRSLDGRYLSLAYVDANTGALVKGLAHITSVRFFPQGSSFIGSIGKTNAFGSPGAPAGHPVPRSGDNYTALDLASGNDVDIQTLSWPTETTLTRAPSPISTIDPERMPAWSPDGIRLGFVRTIAGKRKLGVFDATPGIQGLVNPPFVIATDAPTPQTRAYQSTWGGLSLANSSSLDVPTVTCTSNCLQTLSASNTSQTVSLTPKASTSTTIGIFVARVTGTRKLLGRTTPRIRVVGRVPLGRTRKGANRFRWNGKVNGKRLAAGTYLLTYRTLKGRRVLSLSRSIRFTVSRSGRVSGVRAIRP